MTRDEFALFDMINMLSYTTLFMSMIIAAIGMSGGWNVWVKKTKCVQRTIRKTKFAVVALIVTGLYLVHQCHSMCKISMRYKNMHNAQASKINSEPEHREMTSKEHHDHEMNHKALHHLIGPVILVAVLALHIYRLKAFQAKLIELDELKGYTSDWGCGDWKKKCG